MKIKINKSLILENKILTGAGLGMMGAGLLAGAHYSNTLDDYDNDQAVIDKFHSDGNDTEISFSSDDPSHYKVIGHSKEYPQGTDLTNQYNNLASKEPTLSALKLAYVPGIIGAGALGAGIASNTNTRK